MNDEPTGIGTLRTISAVCPGSRHTTQAVHKAPRVPESRCMHAKMHHRAAARDPEESSWSHSTLSWQYNVTTQNVEGLSCTILGPRQVSFRPRHSTPLAVQSPTRGTRVCSSLGSLTSRPGRYIHTYIHTYMYLQPLLDRRVVF